MTINTRDFGTLEIDEKGLIHFVSPILGFEDDNECVVLYDDELGDMFSWLQSIKNSEVCFVMTDPFMVDANYAPTITDSVKKQLGVKDISELVFKVLVVIPEDFKEATVNMKSPVVLNPKTQKAIQIVLEDDYSMRALLIEEESVC